MSEFEEEVLRRLERIERNTRIAIAGEHSIVATIADLDAEIAGELTTAVTAIETEVTTLEGQIAAGSDTSESIAKLKALTAGINAVLTPPAAPTVPAAGS